MNNLSEGKSGANLVEIEMHYDHDVASVIDAICTNCNKRFKSIRAVSMHLKNTGARHLVIFIDYGKYNRRTGLRGTSGELLSLLLPPSDCKSRRDMQYKRADAAKALIN